MSKIEYGYGWSDPKAPTFEIYRYEMMYKFRPLGYAVVKQSLIHPDVNEVIASGLTYKAAEGFMKLLKEN